MRRVMDLLGLAVTSVRGGAAIGTVAGIELDLVRGRICYLHLRTGEEQAEIILPWSAVCTVDARVITVFSVPASGNRALTAFRTLPRSEDRVLGDVESIHPIAGFAVDEISGRVTPLAPPRRLIRDLRALMLDLGYSEDDWGDEEGAGAVIPDHRLRRLCDR